jgi:hypothetical protein
MQILKKTLAAALFAVTAISGTTASALEPGFMSCRIVGETPDSVFIEALVDPSLDQQFATVSCAPLPGAPPIVVGSTILRAGSNILVAAKLSPAGTYVVESNGRKSVTDDQPGLN